MGMFHCWWLIRHGNPGVLPWLLVVLEGEDFPRGLSNLSCWTVLMHLTQRGMSSACPQCHPGATSPITSLHPLKLSAQHHDGPRASDHCGHKSSEHHGPRASDRHDPRASHHYSPELLAIIVSELLTIMIPELLTSMVPNLLTSMVPQLLTIMAPELLSIMIPELLSTVVPELLTPVSRRWENSKDGHKFPAISPVGIPTQHICLCDSTNSLPFSNRKPERITHIHLVKDARLFTVISYH